jgi:folate-binding protein YgfZ
MDSSVAAQYQAMTDKAALLDLSARGKLKATGADHLAFLQAMITNEVLQLPEWQGRRGCLLTPAGKIVADFLYYRFPDGVLLDLPPGLVSTTQEALEGYIVMDEVELHDIGAHLAHIALLGPLSAEVLDGPLRLPLPGEPYHVREARRQEHQIWVVNKPQFGLPGFEILLPRVLTTDFRELLIRDERVLPAGPEALDLLRLEQGVPAFGVDYDRHNNPLEAGLSEAISYSKGCYLGQEVVSKATYVGGVNRLLVPLRIEARRAPEKGAEVTDEGGRKIGQVTSAVFSPGMGQVVALAYIRKRDLESQANCRVRVADGSVKALFGRRPDQVRRRD